MNEEQRIALEKIREGKNIFLTGPGGTGKSFFIEALRNDFTERYPDMKIATVALTGCAAILLGNGAKTLHSWAGIGLGKGSVGDLVAAIRRNRKAAKNWMTTQLLIIDEISMMSAELFEKLNAVAKVIRRSSAAFGGLQLLLVGDFYQLPPVIEVASDQDYALFAFEAPSWPTTVHETVVLKQIHRQTDSDFKTLLEHVRVGNLRPEDADMLRSRMGLDWQALEIRPTLLFARRAMVDRINSANLAALEGETISWKAKTVFTADETAGTRYDPDELAYAIGKFDQDGPYDETLSLKDRAQVMLITNLDLDRGLVNGSRGVLVGFDRAGAEPLPIVQCLNGQRITISRHSWILDDYKNVARSQIPLRLAWAGTIHKSQGATLDCALIDIGRTTFEYGQAYVALSRVKSLESLYIHDFAETSIKAHPKVKAFYETMTSPGGVPK